MNLHHLKVFHAVAETGNFTQAATRLFISQPAVSIQVRRLEEALGVALVEVHSRRVRLTEAGARLHEFTERMLGLERDAEAAMAEFRDPRRGSVRVGASTTPGTYLLPGIMAAFGRECPEVQVTLVLGNTRSIEERLLAADLDLGIVGEDLTGSRDLVLQPWYTDRIVVVAPPAHPLADTGPVALARMLGETLILREPGSSTREFFAARLGSLGLAPGKTLELASTEAIKEAVAAGLGLGVVSELAVAADRRAGRLAVLDVPDLGLERTLHLILNKHKRLSLAAAAFRQFLKESGPELAGRRARAAG